MESTRCLVTLWRRTVDRLQQNGPLDIARGLVRFMAEYPTLVFGLVALMVWSSSAPALETMPASTQAIYKATYTVGTIWLVVWMVWHVVVGAAANPAAAAIGFFERFILLSLALVAVRTFGVELADMMVNAKANPDSALAIVGGVIVVRVASAFAPARNYTVAREVGQALYAARAQARRERSPQDMRRTAVHEAGHLLLIGSLGELPTDLEVKVLAVLGDHDLYRGYIRYSGNAPAVLTEGYLYWSMLMHLAGSEAEFVALGERADGSSGDNGKWLEAATAYLSSGFGEVFYATPDGEAQLAHNRAVLNDLKTRCVIEAREILMANRALLDELAAQIAERKSMASEQLAPYLARVVSIDALQSTEGKF